MRSQRDKVVWRSVGRAIAFTCASIGSMGVAACGIGTEPVGGAPFDAVEIHAILDPSRATQEILVERPRPIDPGHGASVSSSFDPSDPIASQGGLPVTNAQVIIIGGGDSVLLEQKRRPDGMLTGVYVARNVNGVSGQAAGGPPLRLVAGQRYTLKVRVDGSNATTSVEGHTQVPGSANSKLIRADTVTFNVAGPSEAFRWARVQGAQAYLLTVTHPTGVFTAILSDTVASIDGALHDPGHGLAPVFVPGFEQSISVIAIDSAYYDWVRVERINAAEIKTHLTGGLGVFGSALPLIAHSISTTTSDTAPPNGRWIATDSAVAVRGGLPLHFDIYRGEAHAGVVRLSGQYVGPAGSGSAHGLLGEIRGDSIQLALLREWSAVDTVTSAAGAINTSQSHIILSDARGAAEYTRVGATASGRTAIRVR
jgi:hypothetical protein